MIRFSDRLRSAWIRETNTIHVKYSESGRFRERATLCGIKPLHEHLPCMCPTCLDMFAPGHSICETCYDLAARLETMYALGE